MGFLGLVVSVLILLAFMGRYFFIFIGVSAAIIIGMIYHANRDPEGKKGDKLRESISDMKEVKAGEILDIIIGEGEHDGLLTFNIIMNDNWYNLSSIEQKRVLSRITSKLLDLSKSNKVIGGKDVIRTNFFDSQERSIAVSTNDGSHKIIENNKLDFEEYLERLKKSVASVILDIEIKADDYTSINVLISEEWYNSSEVEQKNFVIKASELINDFAINNKTIKDNEYIYVYFYDEQDNMIAKPNSGREYLVLSPPVEG